MKTIQKLILGHWVDFEYPADIHQKIVDAILLECIEQPETFRIKPKPKPREWIVAVDKKTSIIFGSDCDGILGHATPACEMLEDGLAVRVRVREVLDT